MGFELHISCSKDIDELHINFSDGTSSIVGPEDKPKSPKPSTPKEPNQKKPKVEPSVDTAPEPRRPGSYRDQILDLDAEFGGVSQDIIKPPEIQREDRPVKVADELQNFDF